MKDIADIIKGLALGADVQDAIGSMINTSGRRCFVVSTDYASAIYKGLQVGELEVNWSEYDAILLPFRSQGHWRLAVSDLTTFRLYYLDSDLTDRNWHPRIHIRVWLIKVVPGNWRASVWVPPQQMQRTPDCAVAVTLLCYRLRGAKVFHRQAGSRRREAVLQRYSQSLIRSSCTTPGPGWQHP